VLFGSALVVGIARIGLIVTFPEYHASAVGGDYSWFMFTTRKWLTTGDWYFDYQLVGPYDNQSGQLYPPSTLALFVPFTVLPAVLWWLIPIGVVATFVVWCRPTHLGWSMIVAWLTLPAISIVHLMNGNTTMWAAALLALALRWPWVAAMIAPLKPSLAPFGLVGVNSRAWWLGTGIVVAINIPLVPLWLDYVTALRNAYGPEASIFYSVRDLPLMAIPLVAWLNQRSRPGVESVRKRNGFLAGPARNEGGARDRRCERRVQSGRDARNDA
jgi:hypothetical protein